MKQQRSYDLKFFSRHQIFLSPRKEAIRKNKLTLSKGSIDNISNQRVNDNPRKSEERSMRNWVLLKLKCL